MRHSRSLRQSRLQERLAPSPMLAPAVFFDRDGTLIEDQYYRFDPAAIRLIDGAVEALRRLQSLGYKLVVATNQSGVALAYFSEKDVQHMHRRLGEIFAEHGVYIDAFYYCPHLPEGVAPGYAVRCQCRKPASGMLLRAAADLGLDLQRSWMVGDIWDDVRAGLGAGCRAVIIGHEGQRVPEDLVGRPDVFVAHDLIEAAHTVLVHSSATAHRQPDLPED